MVKEYYMYMEMVSLLDQYEEDIYSDWCNGLEHACLINLNQPLLSRNTSSGLISVNFSPKVINVMSLQTRNHTLCKHLLNNYPAYCLTGDVCLLKNK